MKRSMFPVCGPAKKSRNWFLNVSATAALIALTAPVSAQSITVTGVAPSAEAAVLPEASASAGPPRSIVEPYKATAPRSRGPLALLVAEPQSRQIASVRADLVADEITSAPTRSLPTITVSNLSVPSTNR